jgi:hypothetical protein
MSATIRKESPEFYTVEIGGLYTYEDHKALEQSGRRELPREGKIRILILMQKFEGWGTGGDWGNLTFMHQHDRPLERIAVVADERWRSEILMFLAAGLRQAEVEFFLQDEENMARAWLNKSSG